MVFRNENMYMMPVYICSLYNLVLVNVLGGTVPLTLPFFSYLNSRIKCTLFVLTPIV